MSDSVVYLGFFMIGIEVLNDLVVLGGLVLSLPAKLLCGGMAGAVAQSFSYPMDVTRRRMQLAMMSPETKIYA